MLNSCKQKVTERPEYPVTEKTVVTDEYFGTRVEDPYRWLEDDMSEKTAEWVKKQNELTFGYLSKIPYRDEIKKRLESIFNYEKFTSPFHEGDYMYF